MITTHICDSLDSRHWRCPDFGMSGLRRLLQVGLGACVIAVGLSFLGSPAQASFCVVPEEDGTWVNYDANTRGITQLMFRLECRDASATNCSGGICSTTSAVSSHYFIRLYGSCYPADCDWGEVEGQALTGSLDGWYYFHYDQGYAKRYVYVQTYAAWPGWLRLWVWTDFTDPSRADYAIDDWFRRP